MPSMICRNLDCKRPIEIPLTKLHGKSPAQRQWPTDGKPRNFLCRKCKHVSEYIPQNILPPDHEAKESQTLGTAFSLFRISIECGQGTPAHCVHILVSLPTSQLAPDEASTLITKSQSVNDVKCDAGHVLTWTKGQQSGPIGWPEFDFDWTRLE